METVILSILFVLLSSALGYRNNKVFKYTLELNERCYNVCVNHLNSISDEEYTLENAKYYEHLRNLWKSISNLSYNKMVLMFWKPLKDEYWLSKEQIEFLNLNFTE